MQNMTWSIYSDDFIKEVATKTGFDISIVRELSNEFKKIIQPEMEEHYLSHLISSIEGILHRAFTTKFLNSIKEQNLEKDKIAIIDMIRNNKLRFYPIILRKVDNLPVAANIRYIKNVGAIVYYASNITDEKQIRMFIAHEVGHIYFDRISKIDALNSTEKDIEDYASLFAIFAIADKNEFYNVRCKNIAEENSITAINTMHNILSQRNSRKRKSGIA